MQFDVNMLAYCGFYCEQCSFRTAFQERDMEHLKHVPAKYRKEPLDFSSYDCEGCKGNNLCGPCRIKDCAKTRVLHSCAECDDFPCAFLDEFENDGIPHHRQAIANLRQIRKDGLEAWFQNIEPPLHCHCGKRQSWYRICTKHEKLISGSE